MAERKTKIQDTDFVTTFAKGLRVIKSFQYSHASLTLSEVAELNDLSRASARRFLLTLESLGYVKQDGNRFGLTAKILELGYGYMLHFNVQDTVRPLLSGLANRLKVACSAAVLEGQEVIYIARTTSLSSKNINIHVGERLPGFATSAGRVLISHWSEEDVGRFFDDSDIQPFTNKTITDRDEFIKEIGNVKRNGYAVVNQELDVVLRAVAVPVKDSVGNVVMSINLSQHIAQMTFELIHEVYVPALQEVAKSISQKLP